MSQDPTAGNFIRDQSALVGPPPVEPDAPKVPFQGSLKLTGEQEKKMIEHAFTRMQGISNELGRDQTLQPTWWANLAPSPNMQSAAQGFLQASTFLGKRSRFDAAFMNDVSWRPWTMGVDNIFMQSNITVPLSRRITSQMIARAKKSFFGSNPWLAVESTPGVGDQQMEEQAERIERYARFKAKESKSAINMGRAISMALQLGECAVKTTYQVRDQIFDTDARVLTGADGAPMRDTAGNTIPEDAQWVDAEDGRGTQVLAHEAGRPDATVKPDAPVYTNQPLNRRQVLFEGAVSEPIYYKDFLCPLTAQDVQQADCVVHIYDKRVAEFIDIAVKGGMVDPTQEGRLEAAQKMMALIEKLDANNQQPKAAVNMAIRPNENFTPTPSSAGDNGGPVSEFAEFYMWYDANGDGIAENIILICERSSRAPIYYEHVANVTVDGLRPIEIVRIKPIEGRWYGQGIMEYFESYQTIVDLMVNRWNMNQSRSGRVDFWNPKNTVEGDRDPHLKMNWGGTYTKKPGMKAEDCLETVKMTDEKFEALHTMIQFFMQLAMNESGVTNANDGAAAGQESAKLATGIMQIEQSGDELFMPLIQDLTDELNAIVNREVNITLSNLDKDEIFTYLNGDTAGLDTITPQDVAGLRFRCTIEMTTHKNQQILQLSAQAIALVKDFYIGTPPQVQPMVIDLYRKQLRVLEPSCNPEEILKLPAAPLLPMPGGAPGAAGGEAPPAGGMPPQAPATPSPMESAATAPKAGVAPAQMTQVNRQPMGAQKMGSTQV